MGKFGGLALKSLSWFLRFIEFCCAAIILGIFSYFLSVLHNHGLPIETYLRAVEGISGVAVCYTIAALVLVFCLGGVAFLALFAMVMDFAFTGAFIYVAFETRHGANSCSGDVNTPLGSGNAATNVRVNNGDGGFTHLPKIRTACKLNTACFSVAIIAIFFFFFSLFVEFLLARHHKREKAFGPSPNNGYTAGSPKRKFWQRKPKNRVLEEKPDALPAHTTPADVTRDSYATESTAVGTTTTDPTYAKYGHTGSPHVAGGLGSNSVNGSSVGYQTSPHTHQGATQAPATAAAAELPAQQTVPGSTWGWKTTTTTHTPHRY